MAQTQRNHSSQKLSSILRSDAIESKSGTIRLMPLIERNADVIISAASKLEDFIGIPICSESISIFVFNASEFRDSLIKRDPQSPFSEEAGGQFFPEERDVWLNASRALLVAEARLQILLDAGRLQVPDVTSEVIEHFLATELAYVLSHELAHYHHHAHNQKLFDGICIWNAKIESGYKFGLLDSIEISHNNLDLLLLEGVACWLAQQCHTALLEESGHSFRFHDYTSFRHKSPSLFQLASAVFLGKDIKQVGYWFVSSLYHELGNQNPVSLILDNPLTGIRELAHPERYLERLRYQESIYLTRTSSLQNIPAHSE
jgi:hypothetical protein